MGDIQTWREGAEEAFACLPEALFRAGMAADIPVITELLVLLRDTLAGLGQLGPPSHPQAAGVWLEGDTAWLVRPLLSGEARVVCPWLLENAPGRSVADHAATLWVPYRWLGQGGRLLSPEWCAAWVFEELALGPLFVPVSRRALVDHSDWVESARALFAPVRLQPVRRRMV
ncbi:hypothetical protein [Parachitinimonas caeni]|uniref:Uncharacterized protein n=1 Tax=Parachitinimonas caeni TaxID=3031301 RepID=A0ABT7DUE9_9NEIS|nr:hypothetical protein [Parachitinimonas caeni]MDK2123706.1 hypothetical protein [Parachitinimonas caeni]